MARDRWRTYCRRWEPGCYSQIPKNLVNVDPSLVSHAEYERLLSESLKGWIEADRKACESMMEKDFGSDWRSLVEKKS